MLRRAFIIATTLCLLGSVVVAAEPAAKKKKLLLIGQGPDGHPVTAHEYYAGLKIVEKLLAPMAEQIEVKQVRADGEWKDGPELLKDADGAVLYLAEGAKWTQGDPRRYEAFAKLTERGGGLVALHWAIGTKDAKYVAGYQKLIGGVHGGEDRKYKFLETTVEPVDPKHPITQGIEKFTIKDEFYYQLKFVDDKDRLHHLLKVKIDDELYPFCWTWDRADGGRSFGFSALHYHENWKRAEYRQIVANAIVWSLKLEAPKKAWPGEVAEEDYKLPPGKER